MKLIRPPGVNDTTRCYPRSVDTRPSTSAIGIDGPVVIHTDRSISARVARTLQRIRLWLRRV